MYVNDNENDFYEISPKCSEKDFPLLVVVGSGRTPYPRALSLTGSSIFFPLLYCSLFKLYVRVRHPLVVVGTVVMTAAGRGEGLGC